MSSLRAVVPALDAARSFREWAAGTVSDVADLSADGLRDRLQELERISRACEAEMLEVLDVVDRRGVFSVDGHHSLRGWIGATVRWSDAEIRDRCRSVNLIRDVPKVANELRDGQIGVAQVRELARVRANPRCGDQVVEVADELIEEAEQTPFNEFRRFTRRWEDLHDQDGAHQDHAAAHEGRRVSTAVLDNTFHLAGQFGNQVQGAAIAEILARFETAEFQADWDELRARFGDDARASMLERTATQRRADAIYAIFLAAASAPVDARPPEPVVNIVVDRATFEEHLFAMTVRRPPPQPDIDDLSRRCETVNGDPVDPDVAVAAAVVGHVRRVVMNSANVVTDMGRKERLFRGSPRTAALLQGRRCSWPGCGRSTGIQIDHTEDWQHHGPTAPANASPTCSAHNRFKNHGYRLHRDDHGHWHTYRPDGTEITAI